MKVIYFNYKLTVMDLEFITAMLNHKEMSFIFKTLRKYKSPFIVLFDNMTDRLAVIFLKYIVKYFNAERSHLFIHINDIILHVIIVKETLTVI